MLTTRYSEEQVLRKRPYLRREWCERALREAPYRQLQPDGRVRLWIFVPELGRYLRVVTLDDGETVHNAFPDRDFEGGAAVKFHYYPETDSLYIDLTETVSVDSREVAPGVVLDFGADGRLVGIDVDQASKFVNLSHVEAEALPVASFSLLAGSKPRSQEPASFGLAVRETGEEYMTPSDEESSTT